MIGLEDRQRIAQDIGTVHADGARLYKACAVAGIDVRTLQRWQVGQGLVTGDLRPSAVRPRLRTRSAPTSAQVLQVANEARFADVPPARIVPILADGGVYVASESTFSRVLLAAGQATHRGRAKTPRKTRPPTTHVATAPRQVWCWDMTYLPANIAGRWFYLYLILDLYTNNNRVGMIS
ncbi:transposase InsO family protein [Duganella sp. 3397]|nr:transposase InsO family protein [Duganella sp. 3397]